jgi:hypothetical protein
METLSNAKIESILSLTGNNKCFECESPEVDWVSFPAAVFICHNCGRRHKEFKFKPTLKSLSVSEFTSHEIKKMNLGGNARYHTLMDEYKISLKEPNIEYKYQTVISLYYFRLLEIQVRKIENDFGADEEYNKILNERPTYDVGSQPSQGFVVNEGNIYPIQDGNNNNGNINNGNINDKYKTGSTLGGWLGYFGDQLNNVTEYFGINNVINNASNSINNTLENYHIKDTLNKAVDYTKSAGGYIVDKAKEISQNPVVNETKERITQTFGELKDTAINMIKNATDNINNNQNHNHNQ